jgi:hypothetical protein
MKQKLFFSTVMMVLYLMPNYLHSQSQYSGYISSGGSNPNGRIYYTIDNNYQLEITGPNGGWIDYYKPKGEITIPNTITHYGTTYFVRKIGGSAFAGCDSITSITFPDDLQYIGSYAFSGCSSLVSITIPDAVSTLGYNAFRSCVSIDTAIIGRGITSYVQAFWGCTSLKTVIYNVDSCTFSMQDQFPGCDSISSFIFGNTVKVIPYGICYGMQNLSSVTMSGNVRIIKNNAFSYCNKLTSVTIDSNTLIVTSSDTSLGKVRLAFPVTNSWNQTVTASVYWTAEHYHFDSWSNGGGDYYNQGSQTVTLTSDSTLTAYFAIDRHSIYAYVNNDSLGIVSYPDSNIADYGDTLIVVASPIAHHHVASWNISGYYYTLPSIQFSPKKDTVWIEMTGDIYMGCNFAIDTHNVEVIPNDNSRGTITGGGEYVYNTPCVLTAIPYSGYTFLRWSNGETANPYAFPVVGDVTLTAVFLSPDEETYTITVESNNSLMGTASVNGIHEVTVINGESVSLIAEAYEGYHFSHWNDNDTHAVRTVTVTSNTTYIAYFESNGGTEGMGDVIQNDICVYYRNGCIVADGFEGKDVKVFDIVGRCVRNETLPNGVYLVKVGNYPAQKVLVFR